MADGLITQAQADEILSGDRPTLALGRWSNWLSENGIDYQAYLAEALGITVEELQAARSAAFIANVEQAVADGTITQEKADLILGRFALAQDSTFQSSMQTAFEAAVNQAVADGVITQAQADQILANHTSIWMDGIGGRTRGHRGSHLDTPDTTMQGPEPESPVIVGGLLQQHKRIWDAVEVTSYEPAALLEIQRVCPGLATDLLLPRSESWKTPEIEQYEAVQYGRMARARAVHIHPSQLSAAMVQAVRAQGIEVHAWDVNDDNALGLVAQLGIPRLDTDNLRQALAFREGH